MDRVLVNHGACDSEVAALAAHFDVVRMLVERGARLDLKDIHHDGTAADWADFGGHSEIAEYLRNRRID
jgi:chromosome condensin MukBEF complex kleisin-like MukF subunit